MSRSVRAARVSLLVLVQLVVLGLVMSAFVVAPVAAAPGADLTVTKSVNDPTADPGQAITYTVVVTNSGDVAAEGVRVDDGSIDTGQSTVTSATWTSGGSAPAACTVDTNNNVRCDIGTLAPAATATVTINVTIASDPAAACPPAPTGGTDDDIRNIATARATNEPAENQSHPPENRSNPVDVNINCPAPPAANVDLVVTKTTSAGTVNLGGSVTFTVAARNAGTDPATNVVVSDGSIDTGQSSVTNASWRIGTGAVTPCAVNTASNGVTCTIGTLAAGATATVTINVTIASDPAAACPPAPTGGTDDDIRNTAAARATNEPPENQTHPPESRSNAVTVEINCAGGGNGPTVTRVAGPDRYGTAAAVSSQLITPQGGGTVYITNGLNFPDALAGAPAARKDNAPLLLVTPTSVPAATCSEIGRLDPTKIVALGSAAVVSDAVVTAARGCSQATTTSERLAGPDRYATAAAVAASRFPTATTVMLAYGLNFPDALSGSGAAANFGMPILLTNTNSLPAATCQRINDSNATKIYVLGSAAVVSDAVVALARNCSGVTTTSERLAGADRYATSAAINARFFNSQNADDAMVATGLNFPDALGAGADGAPVYLTQTNSLPPVISSAISALDPARIFVIGGPSVVTDNVMTQLRAT